METNGENPLLDSRFPDVSGKGRGYQIEAFSEGTQDWPELRKVSLWQTIGALEQEFREKAASFAQSKVAAATQNDNTLSIEAVSESSSEKQSSRAIEISDKSEKARGVDEPELLVLERNSPTTAIMSDNSTAVAVSPQKPQPQRHINSPETETFPSTDAEEKVIVKSAEEQQKGSKNVDSTNNLGVVDPNFRPKQALPHHLPKMDGLSSKLEDIRRTMGDAVSSLQLNVLLGSKIYANCACFGIYW